MLVSSSRCFFAVPKQCRFASSLAAPSRRWGAGGLKQWSLFPRRAAAQPAELALWDKLIEPAFAKPSDTLPQHLAACVASKPFGEALAAVGVEEEYTWDYPTMQYLARGCAAGLLSMGHKHGSCFATWMHNGPEAVLLSWAASLAGCVHIAISPSCSFEEVEQIIARENVRTLYFQERLGGASVFESVASLARNAHDGSEVNWLDSKKHRSLKQLVNATGEAYTSRTMTLSSCTPYDADPHPVDYVSPWLHASQDLMITYSHSNDKLVRTGPFSSADVLAEAGKLQDVLKLHSDDRILLSAPAASLSSMATLVAASKAQAKIITVGREFQQGDIEKAADKQRPTAIVCTQQQGQQLADSKLPGLVKGVVVDSASPITIAGISVQGMVA